MSKKKKIEPKNKVGRPTMYTKQLGENICDIIAISDKSLTTIINENPEFPKHRTIRRWIEENKEFRHNYELAKEAQADFMFEGMLDLTEDALSKINTRKIPNFKASSYVALIRLRQDAFKFHAMKLKPKKYGDKIDVTSDNKQIKANVLWLGGKQPAIDNP